MHICDPQAAQILLYDMSEYRPNTMFYGSKCTPFFEAAEYVTYGMAPPAWFSLYSQIRQTLYATLKQLNPLQLLEAIISVLDCIRHAPEDPVYDDVRPWRAGHWTLKDHWTLKEPSRSRFDIRGLSEP